jgi:putative thioredoxin
MLPSTSEAIHADTAGTSIPSTTSALTGSAGAALMYRRYPRDGPASIPARPGMVMTMIDVTDATFEQEVLVRSAEVPVVVDLWAPWCEPCKTLGPIIERVVDATGGAVALAKVNVDENPAISASFQVQSIPAVFALRDRAVVNSFIGALPEAAVTEFVAGLLAAPSEADQLVAEGNATGSEELLRRALELQPDHAGAITGLAALLIENGDTDGAIAVLGRIPETPEIRRLLAEARLASRQVDVSDVGVDDLLSGLLDRVKEDPDARQEFVDLLETLGPEDPRTSSYRKALAARLF